MQIKRSSSRLRQALAILIFVCLLIVIMMEKGGITAQRNSVASARPDQPASEGRPITPAGELVVDLTKRSPAVGALTCDFVKSPDTTGTGGRNRYLVAVNSGFGIQFSSATNRAQQSLAVIDLEAKPVPAVIQNVYFPSPQSVNVGVAFSPIANDDGSFTLFASGGFENKIWMFKFQPGTRWPISPASPGPDTKVEAPFIDVSSFASQAPTPRYNNNHAAVYPSGLAISGDGNMLLTANDLDDSLGVVDNIRGQRTLERISLPGRENPSGKLPGKFTYPYAVAGISNRNATKTSAATNVINGAFDKAYVSLWNDASIAVVDLRSGVKTAGKVGNVKKYIEVGRHPTAIILNPSATRLYVVNSGADSVSVIDTASDKELERIDLRTAEGALIGDTPEGLTLSENGESLYVANARSNSISVVSLSAASADAKNETNSVSGPRDRSRVRGLIPTGQYPSAVAVARGMLFIGNGKGTGLENSSLVVNNSGRAPNVPNDRFPVGTGRGSGAGGQYSLALIVGNISRVAVPTERELKMYSQAVMRNNSL